MRKTGQSDVLRFSYVLLRLPHRDILIARYNLPRLLSAFLLH